MADANYAPTSETLYNELVALRAQHLQTKVELSGLLSRYQAEAQQQLDNAGVLLSLREKDCRNFQSIITIIGRRVDDIEAQIESMMQVQEKLVRQSQQQSHALSQLQQQVQGLVNSNAANYQMQVPYRRSASAGSRPRSPNITRGSVGSMSGRNPATPPSSGIMSTHLSITAHRPGSPARGGVKAFGLRSLAPLAPAGATRDAKPVAVIPPLDRAAILDKVKGGNPLLYTDNHDALRRSVEAANSAAAKKAENEAEATKNVNDGAESGPTASNGGSSAPDDQVASARASTNVVPASAITVSEKEALMVFAEAARSRSGTPHLNRTGNSTPNNSITFTANLNPQNLDEVSAVGELANSNAVATNATVYALAPISSVALMNISNMVSLDKNNENNGAALVAINDSTAILSSVDVEGASPITARQFSHSSTSAAANSPYKSPNRAGTRVEQDALAQYQASRAVYNKSLDMRANRRSGGRLHSHRPVPGDPAGIPSQALLQAALAGGNNSRPGSPSASSFGTGRAHTSSPSGPHPVVTPDTTPALAHYPALLSEQLHERALQLPVSVAIPQPLVLSSDSPAQARAAVSASQCVRQYVTSEMSRARRAASAGMAPRVGGHDVPAFVSARQRAGTAKRIASHRLLKE